MGKRNYFYLEYVACGYCWILLSIVSFYLYKFWKRRKTPIIRKRYFGFVVAINLCAIFFVGYLTPFWILIYLTKSIHTNNNNINSTLLFDIILGYPYIVCQHLFTFMIFCRFWLLFFEIKHGFYSKQLDILSRINPNSKKLNWFLMNKNRFGSSKFMLKMTLILCLVVIAISSCAYFIRFNHNQFRYIWYLTDSILLSLPLIGAYIIYHNIPSFFDHFLIRKELSVIIICGIIAIIGYMIIIIELLIYTKYNEIILLIGIVIGATIYCMIALVLTCMYFLICLSINI